MEKTRDQRNDRSAFKPFRGGGALWNYQAVSRACSNARGRAPQGQDRPPRALSLKGYHELDRGQRDAGGFKMNVYQKPNPWNKRRFDWKRDLNRSPDLSNGAKRFGAVLCDQYVRRENGQCWPANRTLATAMALHVRSVQRYIKELMIHGWLQQVHIPRRRRGLQITWPRQAKHDTKYDIKGDIHQSRLSPESDSAVAPYIEPSKN